MGDLVTDHHTNAAIVQRLGKVLAIEQGLQNSRGKDYEKDQRVKGLSKIKKIKREQIIYIEINKIESNDVNKKI